MFACATAVLETGSCGNLGRINIQKTSPSVGPDCSCGSHKMLYKVFSWRLKANEWGSDWSPNHSQNADSRKCGSVMDMARSLYLNNLRKVLWFLAHTMHFCGITLLDWTLWGDTHNPFPWWSWRELSHGSITLELRWSHSQRSHHILPTGMHYVLTNGMKAEEMFATSSLCL